jgi:REP element-mobilizing transposase RayT
MAVDEGETNPVGENPVRLTGETITQDAHDLQTYMQNAWEQYDVQAGLVPAKCLRNDLHTFHTNQEPLTQKAIANRIIIGQTLEKSATLSDFQETVTAQNFDGPNVYSENHYYPSSDPTEPGSLQEPTA